MADVNYIQNSMATGICRFQLVICTEAVQAGICTCMALMLCSQNVAALCLQTRCTEAPCCSLGMMKDP